MKAREYLAQFPAKIIFQCDFVPVKEADESAEVPHLRVLMNLPALQRLADEFEELALK